MDKTCTVEIRTNYGNEQIYPVNKTAVVLCKLLGQKTLTRQNIKLIKELGFAVEAQVRSVQL